jgi:3-oxoacyl-[acyl-carrier protein] reductase
MKREGYAILTGGSRGIGEGLFMRLAKEGYDIVAAHVSDSSVAKTRALIESAQREYGIRAVSVQADVRKYDQCKKIVDAGVSAFGENIAILVNNAGVSAKKGFAASTPEEYTHTIDVNLMGALHCSHATLPYMMKQKCGCIVNTSSIGGLIGLPTQIEYSAAKAGIIGFTKALAKEVGQYNIRVNSIAPGWILTDITRNANLEAAIKATPLGFIGEPEDIADCLSYIIGARFLTGQTISPNGGFVI